MEKERRKVPFSISMLVVVFLMIVLGISVNVYELEAHIPILLTAMFAGVIALLYGYKWKELEKAIVDTLGSMMGSLLIFMAVGIVIGTWILSGVVPAMTYYGLQLISPTIFVPTACVIAALVALATGSSWSTVGTVGIALMGIGRGLGFPVGLVAGAIISGAYFGDKMSPLSDTTNMAPAVSGTDLFTHIRHMVYTSTPSFIISVALFTVFGLQHSSSTYDASVIDGILQGLDSAFYISPILLIPPVIILVLVIKKVDALPALLISATLGGIFAMIFQGANFGEVINAAHYGFQSQTGVEAIDSLLSGGGLDSMLNPLSLVFMTSGLAGVMEASGMIESLTSKILSLAKGVGGLIAATVFTAIAINILTGDQYLSIVFTGKMYQSEFAKMNLHPKNLSRTLEDAGTLTSPLIPWGACGIFMSGTLGVPVLTYLPYMFLSFFNPIIAIIYGFTGFTIEKLDPKDDEPDTLVA